MLKNSTTFLILMILLISCGGGGSSGTPLQPSPGAQDQTPPAGSAGSGGAAQGYQVQEKIQAID